MSSNQDQLQWNIQREHHKFQGISCSIEMFLWKILALFPWQSDWWY